MLLWELVYICLTERSYRSIQRKSENVRSPCSFARKWWCITMVSSCHDEKAVFLNLRSLIKCAVIRSEDVPSNSTKWSQGKSDVLRIVRNDWLTDLLAHWFIGFLMNRLSDSRTDWPSDWPTYWRTDLLKDQLFDWLLDSMTDWQHLPLLNWLIGLTAPQQTEPYEFQGSWADHFVATPTLLPPFVVNPTQRESHSSHDKSRCLGCMYTKSVGTGKDTTKSSDNMTDGEWTKLPPVMEANVRWYFVSFIMSSVPQLLFCLGWKSYTIKPMSFKFNFDLPLACTFQ